MEVRGPQPQRPNPALQRFEEEQIELIKNGRDKSRRAREARSAFARQRLQQQTEAATEGLERARAERPQTDHVELSAAAREAHVENEQRAEHVERLRVEHAEGQLETPERIDKAAQRLLGA